MGKQSWRHFTKLGDIWWNVDEIWTEKLTLSKYMLNAKWQKAAKFASFCQILMTCGGKIGFHDLKKC